MTRQPVVARRAGELLGTAVVATAPVAGGDIATATKLRLTDGTTALMKTHPQPPEGFFEAEARGLRWLAAAPDGAPVPELLADAADCVILRWIEPGKPNQDTAEEFGRALARTHAAGADGFGGDQDGFIGRLPLPNRPAPTWAEFFAVRRVLPYLKLARDRSAITAAESARLEALVRRFPELLPDEAPSRLHGDLWNGNVIWGLDGRAWLIDPATYGGHREADLAMLSLFGLPHLARALESYREVAPLAEGWQERLRIHQLFPLLVHACMFGGGYGQRAAAVAEHFG